MRRKIITAAIVVVVTMPLYLLLSLSCAKSVAPPGGPVDMTPPALLTTTPAGGTTGVALNQEIEIKFSERINENTVGQALFISPPLKGSPRIETKSDRIVIKPDQPLDSGRTYVVSLAASLQDLHNNRLPNSISFAFSTGDAIDSAGVRGRVYRDLQPLRNFRVFAYQFSDTLYDSLFAITPNYVTETGDSGDYNIEFMSPGEYLIIAAEDKDHDNLLNRGGEQVGIPISLARASRETGTVTLNVTSFDSTSLKLINCSGTAGAAKFRFDTALDSLSARHARLTIDNADTTFAIPAFWSEATASELVGFSPWLTVGREFDLSVSGLTTPTGRKLPGDTISCSVRITKPDEQPPRVLGYYPSGRTLVMPSETLRVLFSEPIKTLDDAVILALDSTLVDTLSGFVTDATELGFTLPASFPPNHTVRGRLDLTHISDLFGNVPEDSNYAFAFQIADPESLGTLTGTIVGTDEHLVIELTGLQHKFHYRKSEVADSNYSWTVYPDIYRITGYLDQNEDGRWNLGSLRPFRFAEPGWLAADSVRVRARFEHEGRVLRFE